MEKYLTTKQVADEAGVTVVIAHRWAKNNDVAMFGRQYLWSESDRDAFLKRNKKRGRRRKYEE